MRVVGKRNRSFSALSWMLLRRPFRKMLCCMVSQFCRRLGLVCISCPGIILRFFGMGSSASGIRMFDTLGEMWLGSVSGVWFVGELMIC